MKTLCCTESDDNKYKCNSFVSIFMHEFVLASDCKITIRFSHVNFTAYNFDVQWVKLSVVWDFTAGKC